MLAVRALLLAVFAVVVCGLALDSARAQEPAAAEGTTLRPGVNLVGWVGEPTSVSQLFRDILQLEAIWAWDAELDDWIVAGRGAPEWLGGLGRVSAGMGLRLVLSGEESFLWQRSTEPTRGLVELSTGWNLVAWSGADGAPLEQVAKGIGWSLREVRRWDAANQRWDVWTSPERSAQLIATDQAAPDEKAEPATMRRGEALWINVVRAVNWLQPTDILPRLVFPGGASDELKARVREDLEAVLAFYGQQYGIQADPDFTVYIPKDIEALIQAQKGDGLKIGDAEAASIRALWNRVGGWASELIVVKQASWPEDLSASEIAGARYVLTHEYFHILQNQLSDSWVSQWLVEGTAVWADGEHEMLDGDLTLQDLREWEQSDLSPRTPTLRSTESVNGTWEYTLGWLAIDQLTASAGSDSWLELWRQLSFSKIGPHGRWMSTPDWRMVFQETFGIPVSNFYAEFNAWQRELAVANGPAASSNDDDTHWIRGRITDESGAPVAGVFVNAIRVEGVTSVGWNQRVETNSDGTFTANIPQDGDYRISVDINDDCTRYYGNGTLIGEENDANLVNVAGSDIANIDIQLPSNVCIWQIRGYVVGQDGIPLAGLLVVACSVGTGRCARGDHTALDGSFGVVAEEAGDYRLQLNLVDGCRVYFGTTGMTLSSHDASLVTVAGANVEGLMLRVPDNVCGHQISGTIIKADGQPLVGTLIFTCREVDTRCVGEAASSTDADGSFAVSTSGAGAYRLGLIFEGCTIYFRTGGFTNSYSERLLIHVASRDVFLAPRQIPAEMCAHRITGRFVDADDTPLAARWIEANGSDGSSTGTLTGVNGRFEIRVPSDGVYNFRIVLRYGPNCDYHLEGQTFGSPDNPVRVSGADVIGVELRLPGTIEDVCG